MKYANMTWGTMEAVINKLGGMEGVESFLRGELNIEKPPFPRYFSTWKTVKIGTGPRTAAEFRDLLAVKGYHKEQYLVDKLLKKADFSDTATQETELNLVCLSLTELGFRGKEVTNREILQRARELNLTLCPAEVGPQLRIQYLDQPDLNNDIFVAIRATESDEYFDGFTLHRDSLGLHIWGSVSDPEEFWDDKASCTQFVFIRK